MIRRILLASFLALAPLPNAIAIATGEPVVLIKNRWMEVTRSDYDAALERVPSRRRGEFSASPRRVQGVLNNLLVTKTLAAQAKAHGTRTDAFLPGGDANDSDRALAAAELRRIEADAGRLFDAQRTAFETKAQEVYAIGREKYRVPEQVRMSDIAVYVKDRGEEAALARAREARKRIVAGDDFAAVAREYSDDPKTRDQGGALPLAPASAFPPDYAQAVASLKAIGEISEPVRTKSAYHIARLDERRPSRQQTFDEVRDAMIKELRTRYVAEQRDLRIKSIHTDPELKMNQAAIDALVTHMELVPRDRPAKASTRPPTLK